MYLFSGKIVCDQCGGNFRGKMQRSIKVYICSTYHKNTQQCPVRKAVKEAEIVSIIERHVAIYGTTDTDIAEMVERIAVGNEGYRIRYKDGSESIAEANRLKV